MKYLDFRNILLPAINILKNQNEESRKKFGISIIEFSTIDEIEISNLESYLQTKIPDFYKKFLAEFNPKGAEIMFHGILGLEEMKYIYDKISFGKEIFNKGYLPIISDNCGNYYCIKENSTSLFFADHEQKYSMTSSSEIYDFVAHLVDQKVQQTAYNRVDGREQ